MRNQVSRRVAVVGGVRIPFCRAHTAYARSLEPRHDDGGAARARREATRLAGQRLGDVSLGAVIKHSRDFNLARESTLSSGLAPETPAFDIQRACGTSLSAAILIGSKISTGLIDAGIAGGTDSDQRRAARLPRSLSNAAARERARPLASAHGSSRGSSCDPEHFKPVFPGVIEPRTQLVDGREHGDHREGMAPLARRSRTSLRSRAIKNAAKAYAEGFYDDLLVEFQGVKRDNNVRTDTSLEQLAKLKPVFDKSPAGTLTAGNSTPLTDGASAVLLCSEEWARQRSLPISAYLTHAREAAVDFVHGEGLLMAPAYAVSAMLAEANLALQDFDYLRDPRGVRGADARDAEGVGVGEVLPRAARARPGAGLDRSQKLNVKGGSVAVGHPFAATGTRLVGTLAKLLAAERAAAAG